MSRQKLRIHNTDLENLVSNLRGEVGEIIYAWILMRNLIVQARRLRTPDIAQDMQNPDLCMLDILRGKMNDEVISRLSELAEEKIGRLTFHFASLKLSRFETEVATYSRFIRSEGFEEKRNYDISHKELPANLSDYKHLSIPYRTVVKGIAHALRLMKKIDRVVLGPRAPYLWREARKRRYAPTHPVKAGYMLLPYLHLSAQNRAEIMEQEVAEGKDLWVDMTTRINGMDATVKANKEWGVILFGQHLIFLPQYPLQDVMDISTQPPISHVGEDGSLSEPQAGAQPASQ